MNLINFSIYIFLKKTLDTLSHYQQVQLSVALAKDILPILDQKHPNDNRPRLAIEAAEAWLADPSEENAEKAKRAGDEAYAGWAADAAYAAYAAYAAWAAKEAADTAAWAAWAAAWAVAHYNANSKFCKTIPDRQEFIEMLGKSK